MQGDRNQQECNGNSKGGTSFFINFDDAGDTVRNNKYLREEVKKRKRQKRLSLREELNEPKLAGRYAQRYSCGHGASIKSNEQHSEMTIQSVARESMMARHRMQEMDAMVKQYEREVHRDEQMFGPIALQAYVNHVQQEKIDAMRRVEAGVVRAVCDKIPSGYSIERRNIIARQRATQITDKEKRKAKLLADRENEVNAFKQLLADMKRVIEQ